MVPTWWNNLAGYYVGASVGVTSLYVAYALPVILRLLAGSRFEHGAWSLGKHYRWINSIAIAWTVLISIVFMLPTTPAGMPWGSGFDLNFVNYAPRIARFVEAVKRRRDQVQRSRTAFANALGDSCGGL